MLSYGNFGHELFVAKVGKQKMKTACVQFTLLQNALTGPAKRHGCAQAQCRQCFLHSQNDYRRRMKTGDDLSKPLGNEADMQLLTDIQGPPSPVADSSSANADRTSATGPAETAAPAVQSPPQSSESAPAEGGATVAKPAASKKRTRAGHESAMMEMVKEQKMFRSMRQILYAQSNEELQAAKEALHALGHVPYSQRVEAFLQCEQQWVLLYRAGLMTRGHNTNNHSEASIRILKDIVLCRNKAYNAVALVEYVMTKWEEYFKLRLLHHAQRREPSHQIRFQNLLEKMPDVPSESIVCLGNAMYSVLSSSGTATYEVDAGIGLCSCWRGNQGAFLKHQAVVQKAFGGLFPNSPVLTLEDCLLLGQLAAGD
ncbi:hypothetical protein MTO96_023438 [Rhipicephalus appendiculatus]